MKCLQRGTIIVAFGGLLLACGQKGPLVLPDTPKHKRSVPLSSPLKPNGGSAPTAPKPAGDATAAPSNGAPAEPASSFNGGAPTSLTLRS